VRLLDDKTEYEAKVIGVDIRTDLALIKMEPKSPLKTVYLGDSETVEVGDWVVAIGNQFQLGQTVTAGIVSAKSRRVRGGAAGTSPDAYIQTDAAINPGSSGGPLFNTDGQVIAINTAIFSPGRAQAGAPGFNIGIGFAIPINTVKSIVPQLRNAGKVTRGLLGVKIQAVNPDIAQVLELPSPDGALVSDVLPDSPASKAGILRKDVIVKFGDTDVKDYEDLPTIVGSTPVGTKTELKLLRRGRLMTLAVQIVEFKDSAPDTDTKKEPDINELGLGLQAISPEQAALLKLPEVRGLLVIRVEPRSVAEGAGFSVGDIIEEFIGEGVETVEEFNKLLKQLEPGKPVLAVVRKPEGPRILTIKIYANQVEAQPGKAQ
jgi:serine protease Do